MNAIWIVPVSYTHLQAKESKTLTGSDQDVEDLIVELLANHTIG